MVSPDFHAYGENQMPNLVIQYLSVQFSEFRPVFSNRPDGSVLISLRDNADETLISRVIPREEQRSPEAMLSFVERLHRDLATHDGPLEQDNVVWFLKHIELQTFVKRSSTHRPRKIVTAGAKLRAISGK